MEREEKNQWEQRRDAIAHRFIVSKERFEMHDGDFRIPSDYGALALYLSAESEWGNRRDASVGVRGPPARQVHASEASQNPGPDQSSQGHTQSNFHVNCSTLNTNHLKSKDTLKKITFKVALVYLVLVLVSANKIIIGR